jgi:hypothetical protein
MAVDYNAGAAGTSQLYTNLINALKNKGDAENMQKARDIDSKGLFGTGIRESDVQDFGNLALRGAEFGEGRKTAKMNNAQNSFQRRMDQSKSRINELRRFGDDDSINEIRAIQAGMNEERSKFENLMGDYDKKSLWDSGFGNDTVGYKSSGEMSDFSKAYMKKTPRSGGNRIDLDEGRRQQGQLQLNPNGIMNTLVDPNENQHSTQRAAGPITLEEFERSKKQNRAPYSVGYSPGNTPDWRSAPTAPQFDVGAYRENNFEK